MRRGEGRRMRRCGSEAEEGEVVVVVEKRRSLRISHGREEEVTEEEECVWGF